MSLENYDVAIIGGGPAGATAAIYLAEYGFKVCLFEKKNFPRETLCGEFLSKEVIEIIKELNLFDKFNSLHPNPINSFRFINGNGKELSANFKFTAYGLRRSAFDNLLLDAARERGVKVFQPYEISKIEKCDVDYKVSAQNQNGLSIDLQCKFVVAAYGKQNILDKTLNRSFAGQKSFLNGVKFHFPKTGLKNILPNEIRIYVSNGIYCGVNEVDNGTVTLAFLENRMTLKKSSRQNIIEFISMNESFKNIFVGNSFEQINELPAYGSGNIYFGEKNLVKNGIFMIGDAAGVIAPLAGDGIGMALQSAKLIASILVKSRKENLSAEETERFYKNSWRKLFKKRLILASFIQKILLQSKFRNMAVYVVKMFPSVLQKLIKVTRAD
ncbi:MAG: FAD-dependent oxidoreductase [Ignavibacteriaceae bacterium]|nr:FAD-dependent oxidoreductase [Ignavibacteriaceae bacterium]